VPVTVSITERDYHSLPRHIQQLVQRAAYLDNPDGRVKRGLLTFTCEEYWWNQIQEAMRAITNG